MRTNKLLSGQDFNLRGSTLGGFNLRVHGGQFSDLSEYADKQNMFGGFIHADDLIKEGKIYYIENFKCKCGDYRFQYGGGWACNNCQSCIQAPDWWKVKVFMDGSSWCVVGENFENLQVSDNVAFGDSKAEALENYRKIFMGCEFCGGSGEFSRDNSDGVAIEGKCDFCKGTGIEQ